MRNIELKARLRDIEAARAEGLDVAADDRGVSERYHTSHRVYVTGNLTVNGQTAAEDGYIPVDR